jgi:uncharacterized protein YbjT (DUF2867 family)
MIIVIGATGNIGKDVVKELQGMGARVRVVARDPEKARKVLGNVEIVQGNLANRASLDAAFKGGTKLFLLGPAGPTQVAEQHNAIEAAKVAGITHVVKLSALGAETVESVARTLACPDRGGVEAVGPEVDHSAAGQLHAELPQKCRTIKQQSVIYGSSKDGKIAMIDTRDIARVAAHALVDPGHEGKTHVLTGGEAVSHAQVAATFSRVLGKPVKYVDLPPEQAKPAMLGMGMPAWLVDDLLTISSFFAAGQGAQVTDAVEKVGKAKPRTIEQFVRDHAKAFT